MRHVNSLFFCRFARRQSGAAKYGRYRSARQIKAFIGGADRRPQARRSAPAAFIFRVILPPNKFAFKPPPLQNDGFPTPRLPSAPFSTAYPRPSEFSAPRIIALFPFLLRGAYSYTAGKAFLRFERKSVRKMPSVPRSCTIFSRFLHRIPHSGAQCFTKTWRKPKYGKTCPRIQQDATKSALLRCGNAKFALLQLFQPKTRNHQGG